MSDVKTGIPITFNVLGKLFPGREEKYVNFLIEKTLTDKQVILGAMKGGQQYIDFNNGTLAAPMGLARYILDSKSEL